MRSTYSPASSAESLTSLKTAAPFCSFSLFPPEACTLAAWPLSSAASALGLRATCKTCTPQHCRGDHMLVFIALTSPVCLKSYMLLHVLIQSFLPCWCSALSGGFHGEHLDSLHSSILECTPLLVCSLITSSEYKPCCVSQATARFVLALA